ncbi:MULTISPECIES: D-ribose ABC transporter substrate-binding protein [Carnobacterium]|uniref:D-ribose ABC transporter substrate-binding protein n=1 Tax=Carnobacterium antarcticum TaxID=2126436 RepID=A0ABW4NPZ8_9LACT|nr:MULTISPECIES: D-ribose ABC transporter substrate-binding protein [unclassified Carnobacterium]ALV21403.1 Ribose ABC transport system, periplasmic ribose-binding protein RbsB [Carnobacterium sp. CP1]QQP69413.1 D-ribose ABC transporter substrate-binding protein [Carnobacterium sp. CS13]
MKKLIGLTAAALLFLGGCGSATLEGENTDSGAVEEKESSDLVVGVSLSTLNNPFFISVKEGITDLAGDEGSEVKVLDAQDDTSKQSNDVDDLIQQGVDILLINPVDSSAITPAVEAANSAGIPVIAIDRSSDGGQVVTLVASDNVEGGKMAAQYIEEISGSKAKVAELEGIPGASATRERGKGFNDYAKDNLDLVDQQTANFDRAEGLTVMENMLQSNPEIEAIFAQNDEMALGAIEAIEAAGKTGDIQVVGFDGTEDGLAAIEAGTLSATVAQQPTEMGKLAMQAAFDHFSGKKVEAKIASPLELIKSDN